MKDQKYLLQSISNVDSQVLAAILELFLTTTIFYHVAYATVTVTPPYCRLCLT